MRGAVFRVRAAGLASRAGYASSRMGTADERQARGPNPVDALLLQALERMTAGESGVVETLCTENPEAADELRERVELLREMQLLPSDAAAMAFPERLGEFRLVRRLGGGGMGVVYEAVQEPLGRTVALKLIRPEHLYFEQSRERFRRETEAVARLAHPGIVTIHTVGEAQGAPYFAMEMIHGATLDQALQQVAGVSPESLLGSDLRAAVLGAAPQGSGSDAEHVDELFSGTWVEACTRIAVRMTDALAHAHSRGVLHRDIKPSNIAVTLEGRVVLLDFGLAALEDNTRLTSAGSTLGSVLYMAPEQLAGRANEIDARTDVYALGVTLYELLALEPPFARADSTQTRAAIIEGQPLSIRARRQGVPRDLEIVCLHAMENDRARRYPSMEAFGADLRAVLEGRPISARPPSTLYRARRWMTRHPALSTAIALGALLVTVLPSALYLQQRAHSRTLEQALVAEREARERAAQSEHRANLEAEESTQVSNFLVALFGASDPYSGGRRDLLARDVLEAGMARVENELPNQPELRARLLERIGESFVNLDLYHEALAPLERALELRRELHGGADVRTASAMSLVASASRLAGKEGGEALVRSALTILEAQPKVESKLLAYSLELLAMYRVDAGDAREALELLSRSGALLDDERDIGRSRRWTNLALTASAQRQLGLAAEAEATARKALELDRELPSALNPWRIAVKESLARALADQRRFDEALEVFEDFLPEAQAFYGDGNAVAAWMKLAYLGLLQDRGRHEGLVEPIRVELEVLRQQFGPLDTKSVSATERLVTALNFEGRFDEAAQVLRDELAEFDQEGVTDEARRLGPTFQLGSTLSAAGLFDEAVIVLRAAGKLATQLSEESRFAVELSLARALLDDPVQRAEASALARRWMANEQIASRMLARYILARIDNAESNSKSAEALLIEAIEIGEASAQWNWIEAACRELLAELRIARGELGPSCADLQRALAWLDESLGPEHLEVREAHARIQAQGLDRACAGRTPARGR